MGHRNSPTQCHDAGFFRVDRSGVAGAAAEHRPARGAQLKQQPLVARPLDPAQTVSVAVPDRAAANRAAVWLLVMGIRFYQAVFAPVMPVGCKFYPSCSRYAAEAIARHGAAHGVRLAAARLWRCRPFTQGGFDPVPDPDESSPNEVRL